MVASQKPVQKNAGVAEGGPPMHVGHLHRAIMDKPPAQPFNLLVPFSPVLFWTAALALAVLHRTLLQALAAEDGPVEAMQALVLLGSMAICACIAAALHRRGSTVWSVLYGGAAIAFFWVAGEEISWGQRLFGIATPGWLAANLQGEANLHNLPGVNGTLYRIVWWALWLVIALSLIAERWPLNRRWRAELWLPSIAFAPAWLCFLSYTWVRGLDIWWFQIEKVHGAVSRLQEPAELILYTAVMCFCYAVLVRIWSTQRDDRPAAACSIA